ARRNARLEAREQGPPPAPSHVSPVRLTCTMIGATPATLTMSGWTVPRQMPAATPASMALPPALRIRAAASAARVWPAPTAHRVPITWGADVGEWTGAFCWAENESRLMARHH